MFLERELSSANIGKVLHKPQVAYSKSRALATMFENSKLLNFFLPLHCDSCVQAVSGPPLADLQVDLHSFTDFHNRFT